MTEHFNVKKKKMPEDLITYPEAARQKGYKNSSAISQLIRRGHIRRYDLHGRPFVSLSEVMAYEPEKPGPKSRKAGN